MSASAGWCSDLEAHCLTTESAAQIRHASAFARPQRHLLSAGALKHLELWGNNWGARLSDGGAAWPEIGKELNPQHDRQVGELIQRVRASHMSAPLQALSVIEAACRAALANNGDASGVDALTDVVADLGSLAKVRW